jgi:hypothetical protein
VSWGRLPHPEILNLKCVFAKRYQIKIETLRYVVLFFFACPKKNEKIPPGETQMILLSEYSFFICLRESPSSISAHLRDTP